jgi:Protein of unknown function DUF262/Protein of unknown function (DUF1524)
MGIGSIKPEVIALREFFKEEAASLRIPSIQRQFVWDAEDIKDLVDSIISGYPIGAVIIWEPQSRFPSAPLYGKDGGRTTHRYVLDGQQRLTALMLIKSAWELSRGTKTITSTQISYVPDNDRLYLSAKKGIDLSLIVNATLGDADSLLTLQRRYPGAYKKAINGVGEKIVNYKLPFYILRSDSEGDDVYEKIADIFTRVNSAGVKIGNLEMFLSFFAAAFPKEQKDKIIAMHEEFSEQFELDLEPIVRFVFSEMDLTQNQITKIESFRKSIQKLRERFAHEKRAVGRILERARTSIKLVMEILDGDFGASTTQYIPSQSALVPLFVSVFHKDHTEVDQIPASEKRKMLRWFLIASFNGIYSTSTNRKLDEDLGIIRAHPNKFPIDDLLTAMKNRKPHRNLIERSDITDAYMNVLRGRAGKEYLMLLDVLLHRGGATDWEGSPIKSESAHVHHIFPREFLKEQGETREEYINCLGNLTLIAKRINSEIADTPPSEYLPRFDTGVLEKHFIPTSKKLWNFDRYEDFLDARLRLMAKQTELVSEELTGLSGARAGVSKR